MAKLKSNQQKQQVSKKQVLKDPLAFFSIDSPKTISIFIGIIVLLLLIFFSDGIFGGKVFSSPDNLSPLSFRTFLDDAKKDGVYPLWTPYIFMGMPSYASLTAGLPAIHKFFSYFWNVIIESFSKGNLFFVTIPYYFIFAISLFFYIRFKFKSGLIGLYAALTGVFATGIIQLIIVGHHTKMMVFAVFPLVLLLIDKLIESDGKKTFKELLYFSLLSVILFMQLSFNHIQMLFYSYMMIGIYFAFILAYRIVMKLEVKRIIISFSLFAGAIILALAMNADPIMSVKDYNKYSIRGEAPITAKQDPAKTDIKPLDYDYATNWSFSPGEMMTFVIPYYYGFGNVKLDDGQQANLYWGQMPFTDAPVYFGMVTLILALIGIIFNFRRNVYVMALTFIVFFFMMLSFGRTFPLIYDLFFNNMPFFSSFRAPVMIHYYIDLAFTILACFGLKSIIDSFKENRLEFLTKTSFVIIGIGVLMFLIAAVGFEGSYTSSIASSPLIDKYKSQGASAQQISGAIKQISGFAYKNVTKDLMLHGFFVVIIGGLALAVSKKKIASTVFLVAMIALGTVDVLLVSSKTVHWDDKGATESQIKETDYTKWILNKEPDTYQYRIAEFSKGKLTTSNLLAFFRFHMFNGYQGAKIRIYQDAKDIAGDENPLLLGLGNVKYIISDGPLKDTVAYKEVYKGSNIIYENKFCMPRSFFADEYKVETGINILTNIRTGVFNPTKVAYLENDINKKIDKPDSTASTKLTKGTIHTLEYEVNATGNNLLIFSEIYYPNGWKAFIDGQETEIYKTDYLLRGIIVPKGKHKVEMKFDSPVYATSKSISTVANIVVLILLGVSIAGFFIAKKKDSDAEKI